MNDALIESSPERFDMPSYLGPRGWIAVRLDREDTDWEEVAELAEASYRLIAPRKLVWRLDEEFNR